MIPNPKWFPASLQERAAWFDNFDTQMQAIGASLGFTVAELGLLASDNTVVQLVAQIAVELDAYTSAVRQYRIGITEGNIGDPTPVFPNLPTYATPGGVTSGIFERLDDLVKRARVAPAYTDEIGALLGIMTGPGTQAPNPEDVPPVLTAAVDPGNIVEVRFTKGRSDGVYIETNVDNGGWTFADKAVRSPAVFDVPANPANTPRGVQLRARFLDGNSAVGDWSDIVTVQTIP